MCKEFREQMADPDFEGDVTLKMTGDAVEEQEVDIATFVKPYEVKAEQNDLKIDYRYTKVPSAITVTEAEAGLWAEKEAVFAFGLEKAQKAGMDKNAANAWNLILTFALLIGVTLAVPRSTGICTVAEAEGKLAAAGYYVKEYENAISAIFIENFIPSATVELDSDPWNDMYYLFDLDGYDSYAVVNPWTGEIIAE